MLWKAYFEFISRGICMAVLGSNVCWPNWLNWHKREPNSSLLIRQLKWIPKTQTKLNSRLLSCFAPNDPVLQHYSWKPKWCHFKKQSKFLVFLFIFLTFSFVITLCFSFVKNSSFFFLKLLSYVYQLQRNFVHQNVSTHTWHKYGFASCKTKSRWVCKTQLSLSVLQGLRKMSVVAGKVWNLVKLLEFQREDLEVRFCFQANFHVTYTMWLKWLIMDRISTLVFISGPLSWNSWNL